MINTITLDTYKQQISSGDAFNLSDSFNGRVGDEQVPLVVQFTERGLAQQFQNGLVPFMSGFVGSLDENNQVTADTGEAVSYVGTSDDIVGLGRVKMNLPGTMFPQEGYFYGFLGLQNADGKRVTTFNVWFHVYNGNPDMFVNKAPFRTELQKLLDAVQSLINDANGDLNQWKQKLNDLFTTLSAQGTDTATLLTTLQAQIKQSNLFTQGQMDELLGSLTSFKPMGSNLLDKLNNEFNDRGVNVKWFGAAGDGKTDDTKSIQAAIDFFKNSDFETLIFEGTFLCSKFSSDSDNREYSLIFDSLENKNIDLTRAKFITGAVNDLPNLLAFYNCSNINIVGGQAEANTSALVTALNLYNGAFIYANKCTNINIKNTYSKNMCYTACLFNCNTGCVRNNVFTHTQQQADRNLRPASAVLLYSSSHFKVLENDVNGGLRDGDISVFGSGSSFNLVASNHLRSDGTNWEEAITVDGGAKKTIVSNNVIESGYNYGIDIKYNAENTLAIGNIIEKCVVGIADRGGEIDPNAHVFQTIIHDNNIVFGNVPSTQSWGGHRQTGILIDSQFAADVKGNHLTLGRKYDVNYPIYGIMVSQPTGVSLDFISQVDISNNFIELKNGIDSDYQVAGQDSTALCLDTISQGNITNNDIKTPNVGLAVKIIGKNSIIKFSANHFITDRIEAIQYDGNAGCDNLIITDDNYYQDGNLTNAYMYQTTIDHSNQSFVINNKTFGSAKANPFFSITSKWNNTVTVRVDMQYDYAGTFTVSSIYQLHISIGDNMSVSPIDEHNTDVELSSIMVSNNMFSLCAKATRDCPDKTDQDYRVTVIYSDSTNIFS